MLRKIIRNSSRSLHVLALLASGMAPTLAAEPTIYRCGPAGSQWFSQIPCEENSEQVIVKDHLMFKETADSNTVTGDSTQAQDSEAAQHDAASKAQAFITQLEKQRNEQLAEIDRNIEALQSSSENADAEDNQGGDAEEAAILLASMQNTRQSIMSEYEAMISAARQRLQQP